MTETKGSTPATDSEVDDTPPMRQKQQEARGNVNSQNQEDVLFDQNGHAMFIVHDIVDERRSNNLVEFKVRWRGYDSRHDSWEPSDNLSALGILPLIASFRERRDRKIKKNTKKSKSRISNTSTTSSHNVPSSSAGPVSQRSPVKKHPSNDLYSTVKTRRKITVVNTATNNEETPVITSTNPLKRKQEDNSKEIKKEDENLPTDDAEVITCKSKKQENSDSTIEVPTSNLSDSLVEQAKDYWEKIPRCSYSATDFNTFCVTQLLKCDRVAQWNLLEDMHRDGKLCEFGLDRTGVIPLIFLGVDHNLDVVVEYFLTNLKTPPNVIAFGPSLSLFLYAVKKGRVEIVRILLEHGVNVNCRSSHSGYNAYAYALQDTNPHIMELLLKYGVDTEWPRLDQAVSGMMERELKLRFHEDSVRYVLLKKVKNIVDDHKSTLNLQLMKIFHEMRSTFDVAAVTMKTAPYRFEDLFRNSCHWTFNVYRPGGFVLISYFPFTPGHFKLSKTKPEIEGLSNNASFKIDSEDNFKFTFNVSYDGSSVKPLQVFNDRKTTNNMAMYYIELPENRKNSECRFAFSLNAERCDGLALEDGFDLNKFYFNNGAKRKEEYRFCISYFSLLKKPPL